MAELANMPTVSEIASWCDFEKSDDLAGLLTLLVPKRRPNHAFSLPSASSPSSRRLRHGAFLLATVPALSCRPKRGCWEQWRDLSRKAMELKELNKRSASAVPAQCADPASHEIDQFFVGWWTKPTTAKCDHWNRPKSNPHTQSTERAWATTRDQKRTSRLSSWQRSGLCFRREHRRTWTLWEPYGRRIQRKLRFSGQVPGAQGVLQTVQLYGPPTVCEWQACWAISKTGAIMLQELSPSTLDMWEKMVTNYAGRYGAETWAFFVRPRSELGWSTCVVCAGTALQQRPRRPQLEAIIRSIQTQRGSGSFARRRSTPSSGVQSLRNQHCSSRRRWLSCPVAFGDAPLNESHARLTGLRND